MESFPWMLVGHRYLWGFHKQQQWVCSTRCMYFWPGYYKSLDQVRGLLQVFGRTEHPRSFNTWCCIPQHFPVFLMGDQENLEAPWFYWGKMKHSFIILLCLTHPQVCSNPKCTFFTSLLTEGWDYIYQSWSTPLPGGPLWDSNRKYAILSLGMKVRLQHLFGYYAVLFAKGQCRSS